MKSLARRIKGALSLGLCTTIGISMTWSIALGQSTPDTAIAVPEPASLLLYAGAAAVTLIAFRRK